MKKLIFLFVLSVFISQCIAQKLERNEIDEFTGHVIRQTSWEPLNMNTKFTAYFRINRIDSIYTFDLKLMIGSFKCEVFAIDKGQEIMFKFEDESILSIQNLEYVITTIGGGAKGLSGSESYGLKASYLLTPEVITRLNNNKAIKWRIYTTDGYIESDKIADKYFMIPAALKLVCD